MTDDHAGWSTRLQPTKRRGARGGGHLGPLRAASARVADSFSILLSEGWRNGGGIRKTMRDRACSRFVREGSLRWNLRRFAVGRFLPENIVALLLVGGIIAWIGGLGLPALLAQPIDELKAGVVKVVAEIEGVRKIGTGFVVGFDQGEAFVVTAAHVVEGFEVPPRITITFYPQPTRSYPAAVVQKEAGDQRGLAALRVTGKLPKGIRALEWDQSTKVTGDEKVRLIGFPRVARTPWAVTHGNIAGTQGRDLSLTAPADEGNSGGPVLLGEKVIGVVTEVSRLFSYATPALIARYTLENWRIPLLQPSSRAVPSRRPQSSAEPSPRPSLPRRGVLQIQSSPPEAQVLLDGDLVGITERGTLTVPDLLPGEYDVEVLKKGYAPWEDTVQLLEGQQVDLQANLVPQVRDISGTWSLLLDPSVTYLFEQEDHRVTVQVIQSNLLGTAVTAQGEGRWQDDQVDLSLRAAGLPVEQMRLSLHLSDDGTLLSGQLSHPSSQVTLPITLSRTGW